MLTFSVIIEQYLREAGLPPTEILVLQHLAAGESYTLRQLAAKTGKSTGVLDQAMKKLLRKNIIARGIINDSPCYLLHSLQSIVQWLKEDTDIRNALLLRRHQNFVSFLSTLEQHQSRPDLSHFEGLEGMTCAYMKLLTMGEKELVSYLPIFTNEEDHPLRDFHRNFVRERRRQKIFLRVLANDTPLGRRYRSRDPFDYHHTTLVPEELLPLPFERIVVGDVMACFDLQEQKACFLRYPKLAKAEHELFFSLSKQFECTSSSVAVEQSEEISSQKTLSKSNSFLRFPRSLFHSHSR